MSKKIRSWVIALILWSGLTSSSYAQGTPVNAKVLHIVNRLSFGAGPGDVERVKAMGIDNYIKEQLSPDSIPEPQSLNDKLSQLDTLKLNPAELYRQYTLQGVGNQKPTREEIQAARQRAKVIVQQAVESRFLQATTSPRQLQEVMVDFWYNHFNVYGDKGSDRLWVGSYEEQAIRPHVLGRFRDLLEATARHPAMLYYLDNSQNTAPNSPGGRGRGLNENYARELMELHTLGVDGGYTQQDVIALARILTGWGITRFRDPNDTSTGFYFDPKRHDFSDKVFLGHTIKGSGEAEVEQALDILAKSPATAHHISYQLAQYFVSDNPPDSLVKRLQKRFLSTDGNIRDVLDTLFHSPEFWNPENFDTKFKTPYQYVVSAVRATGVEVNNTRPLAGMVQQLGMPLYGCLTPDGYKNTQGAWLSPDAITRRIGFATNLAAGRVAVWQMPMDMSNNPQPLLNMGNNAQPSNPQPLLNISNNPQAPRPQPIDPVVLANTLGNSFSNQTQSAIASSSPKLRAALILGSPEFMRH